MKTAVEVSKDGSRSVYHLRAEANEVGWAWTHPDTTKERSSCSACTSGSIRSAREIHDRVKVRGDS